MDFVTVVLVLLVYYIRPQDWVAGLIGVGIVTPIMAVAIFAMVSRAKEEGRKLQLFLTPLDWWVLALYIFIGVTHPYPYGAFKDSLPLFAFYFVTVQALRSVERLRKYLIYWLIALTVLAMFGLLSKVGIDPTGAQALTASNKGRLALGTWMHNNPNSLAHSVVVIVPLAYFLFFWKGGVMKKTVAIILWVIAYECVYLTESKGAVLAGFATLVLAWVFGKSKIVQVLAITAALAGGGAAISVMPRMSEMGNLRADEGVQGRLLAWEQARTASRNHFTGQGWKTFRATIQWQKMWLNKATHSGYVQVGAELGPMGLALYVGLFWLGLRSLVLCKTKNQMEESCRRCLFALLVGFAISNWMIDRAYHTELFLFFAGISAFHRIMLFDKAKESAAGLKAGGAGLPEPLSNIVPWPPQPMPVLAMAGNAPGGSDYSGSMAMSGSGAVVDSDSDSDPNDGGTRGRAVGIWQISEEVLKTLPRWLVRPTLADIGLAALGAWLVFFLWDYILKNL